MIHIHFGELQEWCCREGEVRQRGAYGLMIEAANWAIERQGATLATNALRIERIDRELPKLLGRRVVSVRFGDRRSEFRFEHGLLLRLSPGGSGCGTLHAIDNWVIFRGENAALALTKKARLQLCS